MKHTTMTSDMEILEHIQRDVPSCVAFVLFLEKGENEISTKGCTGNKTMLQMLGLIELAKHDLLGVMDGVNPNLHPLRRD